MNYLDLSLEHAITQVSGPEDFFQCIFLCKDFKAKSPYATVTDLLNLMKLAIYVSTRFTLF